MAHKRIYFCKGCSAVLDRQVDYCPHCGTMQYYKIKCENCDFETEDGSLFECPECGYDLLSNENETRCCPYCGESLDAEGRDLDRRYCNTSDCGREIGGLIRYSENTGEPLTVDQILSSNDYNKEITDWLKSIYNEAHNGSYNTFYRLLFIYDKTGKYKGDDFVNDYKSIFENIPFHSISDFENLTDNNNITTLSSISKRNLLKAEKHCICTIDLDAYKEGIISHTVISEYVSDYTPGYESEFFKSFRNISATFIFFSSHLPEETKLYSMYDKHILIVSPEILKGFNLCKLWNDIKMYKL